MEVKCLVPVHKTVTRPFHSMSSSGMMSPDVITENEETKGTRAYLQPTWEPQVVQRIEESIVTSSTRQSPYMVALVGIPGSGKTVSALMIADHLEKQGVHTMIMPHDGYHVPTNELEKLPDAKDAVYRRGAPDTFDPLLLYRDLKRIRNGTEPLIMLPGFDHANGDPEPDQHVFDRNRHVVVLCEGLYLLHDADGWEAIAALFDMTIFMNSNVDACMERLKIRNQCIPGYSPEEIAIRCERVDRVNAMTVMQSKGRAAVIVESAATPGGQHSTL